MPSILNTSLTGMLAFQRALDVTSHNIANANTPGYSRQVANFTARISGGGGSGLQGAGTQVSTIQRVFDALQHEQLQSATTGFARLSTLDNLASRIDSFLADSETGLSGRLQSFFNTIQDLTNDPSSASARQALTGEVDSVANRFRSLDAGLSALDKEVNARLELAVGDINGLAASIADVNRRIALVNNSSSPPNDLLDERSRLVMQLSEQVSVSTILRDDGTMNVFIGSGQSLVLGNTARQLGVTGTEFDVTRLTIVYRGSSGNTPLDTAATGGNLGGLLEFRSRVLDPARHSLGQTAIAFASSLNAQHASGMDLRGNLGGDLFSFAQPTVLVSANNTGSGSANATITNLGEMTGADYELEFDGAAYSLTRADTGEIIPMGGSGTPADPLTGAGISIVVGGAPAAGDSLLIRTGRDAAGSLQSVVTDPQSIALAAPTRTAASLANIGDGVISAAIVTDPANPALLGSSLIEFTSPATYSINGAGSFAYTDGDPIVINGSSVSISGTPAVGDQFTIEANTGASGDNSNGLLMTAIQSAGLLDGGLVSINENYGQLVSAVGSTSRLVKAGVESQGVVLSNAENAVLSTSGVNLDEEAANLIRFQQAYQAAAQVISVANSMFDTLLNATRR